MPSLFILLPVRFHQFHGFNGFWFERLKLACPAESNLLFLRKRG